MRVWVTLGGHEAEVHVRMVGDHVVVEADGRTIEADFVRLPDGEVYSLLIGGRSHTVRVSEEAGDQQLMVEVRGHLLPVEVRHPLERMLQAQAGASHKARGETVHAPMPGIVVRLRVQVGDVVQPGQPVIDIEAMKMQNELAAQHGGVVREVLVAERAAVAAGQPLLKLEPEGA